MDLGTHGGFIVAAYGFTALIVVGMIAFAITDQRAQKRALSQLQGEARS